ncbi:MAG: nucleotide exchange factor GrpE [Thermoplasmatota archaeon]
MTEQGKDAREPLTEIVEDPHGALLTVELPGVAQDAIKMAVSGDILKLEADGSRGRFGTIQVLPFEPDPEAISVTFTQGVLSISLKKRKGSDEGGNVETKVSMGEPISVSLEEVEIELERLRDELFKVSEERASLEERVNFLQRDFMNLRRRHENEKESIADRKIEEIAVGLVEVLDTFKLAKESIMGSRSDRNNVESVLKGMEMVENQVRSIFEKVGITRIHSLGSPFDPNFHEAVGYVERKDMEDDLVAQEIKPGYIYKERALRPAQVMVNRKPRKNKGKKE